MTRKEYFEKQIFAYVNKKIMPQLETKCPATQRKIEMILFLYGIGRAEELDLLLDLYDLTKGE